MIFQLSFVISNSIAIFHPYISSEYISLFSKSLVFIYLMVLTCWLSSLSVFDCKSYIFLHFSIKSFNFWLVQFWLDIQFKNYFLYQRVPLNKQIQSFFQGGDNFSNKENPTRTLGHPSFPMLLQYYFNISIIISIHYSSIISCALKIYSTECLNICHILLSIYFIGININFLSVYATNLVFTNQSDALPLPKFIENGLELFRK